jgi:membrane protease YdiL (CAAX protease family)
LNPIDQLPTLVGLFVALGGLVLPVGRLLRNPEGFAARVTEQVFAWALFGLVLAIVILWERQSLSSIGFRLHWPSLAWGLVLTAVLIFITGPVGDWALKQTALAGFERGFAKLEELPGWFLIVAAVTAGVVEETLYRGYAIERLALFTGNLWSAGALAWIAFCLVHAPFWGWGPVLRMAIAGLPILLFYLWMRDLLACMIAHALSNIIGLVILPPRRPSQAAPGPS